MQINPDGAKVRRWREARCWSQDHLAEVAGIGLRTVQRIESGDRASRESVMALASAFEVDVVALGVDARPDAASPAQAGHAKKAAGLRLSLWIHLASYVLGVIVFSGISLGMGGGFVMVWPLIWWTAAIASHGLVVVIVELAGRYGRLHRT